MEGRLVVPVRVEAAVLARRVERVGDQLARVRRPLQPLAHLGEGVHHCDGRGVYHC